MALCILIGFGRERVGRGSVWRVVRIGDGKGHNVKWIVSGEERTCYQFLRMVEHITPVIESQTLPTLDNETECVYSQTPRQSAS